MHHFAATRSRKLIYNAKQWRRRADIFGLSQRRKLFNGSIHYNSGKLQNDVQNVKIIIYKILPKISDRYCSTYYHNYSRDSGITHQWSRPRRLLTYAYIVQQKIDWPLSLFCSIQWLVYNNTLENLTTAWPISFWTHSHNYVYIQVFNLIMIMDAKSQISNSYKLFANINASWSDLKSLSHEELQYMHGLGMYCHWQSLIIKTRHRYFKGVPQREVNTELFIAIGKFPSSSSSFEELLWWPFQTLLVLLPWF